MSGPTPPMASRLWMQRMPSLQWRPSFRTPQVVQRTLAGRRSRRWQRALAKMHSLGRTSTGNSITVYHDTGDAFNAMWHAVDNAKTSVKWQTYICKNDNVGQITVNKLMAARARGVSVELLYDMGGNITGRSAMMEPLENSGATVIAHRSFFGYMWWYFFSGMRWEHSPAIRNHRKILVVDGEVAFAGGLNIGDDYCAKSAGGNGRFRDTQCRVEGPAVKHLDEVYEDTKSPTMRNFAKIQRWRHWMRDVMVERQQSIALDLLQSEDANTTAKEGEGTASANRQSASRSYGPRLSTRVLNEMQSRKGKMTFAMRRVASRLQREGNAATAGSAVAENPSQSERLRQRAARLVASVKKRRELLAHARTLMASTAPKIRRHSPRASSNPATITDAPAVMQVLGCNPHTADWSIQKAFWVAVSHSNSRVWVTTPYYSPHRKLVQALTSAARRGVDVVMLAGSNNTTDPWWMWYASQHLSRRLLSNGIRIYEYHGGQILHAKTVVVDSRWASVGSYNWDVMSNKLLEVCVTEESKTLAAEMERQFQVDVSKAKQITMQTFDEQPWVLRFKCWLAYQFMMKLERFTFWTYKDPDLTSRLD